MTPGYQDGADQQAAANRDVSGFETAQAGLRQDDRALAALAQDFRAAGVDLR